MYSMFSGILVEGSIACHITCLTDDELFTIFADREYLEFSKHRNYVSGIYPKVDKEFTCAKCGRLIE